MTIGIYFAENIIKGGGYTGKSINCERRIKEHLRDCKTEKGKFYNKLSKDSDHFKWRILEVIEEQSTPNETDFLLNITEICWIWYMDSFHNGYNSTLGGEGTSGYKHTEDAKQIMSEANKGENNPNYGKNRTDEVRKKISESLKGENHPNYGKTGDLSLNYGKKHSDERKQKISKANKGKKKTDEVRRKMGDAHFKKVEQWSKDGKTFIRVWNSQTEVKNEIGIHQSSISNVCKGVKYFKTAGGYFWKFHTP